MRSLIPTEAGIIQALGDGHIMTLEDCPPGEFSKGTRIEAATMLQVWELLRDGKSCGFFFYSAFKVVNKGGVLLTYQEAKKGKAKNSTIVFRDPALVVHDITGCGSIAIPTKVNERMLEILKEQ